MFLFHHHLEIAIIFQSNEPFQIFVLQIQKPPIIFHFIKMKFSNKNFFSKCDRISRNVHFLCSIFQFFSFWTVRIFENFLLSSCLRCKDFTARSSPVALTFHQLFPSKLCSWKKIVVCQSQNYNQRYLYILKVNIANQQGHISVSVFQEVFHLCNISETVNISNINRFQFYN